MPVDVGSQDIWRGPEDPRAFEAGATVRCDYVKKKLPGNTPKFACRIGEDDEVKVKFGGTNGEVYAEVAATRLMSALGFPADRIYPVRIMCHGCPSDMAGVRQVDGALLVDPATIERKYPAHELVEGGWSWDELDEVSEEDGGAPRAQRDALKLLAAFMQHTDSKPEQQRLACLDVPRHEGACERPLMMINDVGRTFGRATLTNANYPSSMNLRNWSRTPVWKDTRGCVARLRKSFTGTLDDPVISEAGRAFLSDLLTQLSDKQLLDLFEVSRVRVRPRSPEHGRSGFPEPQEWVNVFKQKRAEIAERQCAVSIADVSASSHTRAH